MADRNTQDDRTLRFDCGNTLLRKDTLLLHAVAGKEAISRPYSYMVTLLCDDLNQRVDPADMIATSASIGMRLDKDRRFQFRHGVIRNFQAAGRSGKKFQIFRAEIVPRFALLQLSTDMRIFQDVTVLEILKQVFNEHKLTDIEIDQIKTDPYPKIEFCVQYRETDFDFVNRLMEENGIYYFFRHEEKRTVMVLGDSPSDFTRLNPFEIALEADPGADHVHSWEHSTDHRTGAWTQGDFSFTTPADPPFKEVKTIVGAPPRDKNKFSRYEFPQHIEVTNDLERFTERRMASEESQAHAIQGASQIVVFHAGLRFGLKENKIFPEDSPGPWLINSMQFSALEKSYEDSNLGDVLAGAITGLWSTDTAKTLGMGAANDAKGGAAPLDELFKRKFADTLTNVGKAVATGGLSAVISLFTDPLINFVKRLFEKKSEFGNTFIAIPDATSLELINFHPPRTIPKPRISGPHTAIVVGPNGFDRPAGADIHTDQWGRVKVKFPWDRSDKNDKTGATSGWIRVAEGWAGGKFGMQFPPRVGQEVLVTFIDGDPNRPVITGRLYNPGSQQPFDAPGTTPASPPPGPFRPQSALVQTTQRRSGIKTASTPKPDGAKSRFHMLRFDDNFHEEQWLMRSQGRMDVTAFSNYFEKVYGNRHINIGGKDPDTGKGGGAFVMTTGGTYDLHVGDARYEGVDAAMQISVKADVAFDYQAKWNNIIGTEATINAQKVVVEASQKITLKVGGNFVVVDSAGVWIKGTMVQINSGGSPDSTSNVTITEPLDAALADPGDPPNWIALHPPGRGGGRRTHTAVAHHGVALTRLPNGTFQFTPGVIINSTDPAYVDAVSSDLSTMNDTPIGHQTLSDIGTSGRTVTIQPRPPGSTILDTGASPANGANRTNGVGTDSTVAYNPSDFPAAGTRTNAPSDVALFHEMDHANHNAHGTNTRDGRGRGNAANGFTNDEEFDTIQDENAYRDQRGPWPGQPADSHRHDHSFAGI